MCLQCPADRRTARAKEGFCVYCHPLTPMKETYIHNRKGGSVVRGDPDAYRIYKCPKCGASWAPEAFAARPKEG